MAYIVGGREFYGLDLEVNENALIPRQESELLVELALERIASWDDARRAPTVVDVGTGSGAIALAVATCARSARIVGVDISRGALEVAVINRGRLSERGDSPIRNGVEFILGDMLTAVAGPADVIVSNPPYIPSGTLDSLAVEVRREPRIALDGGADGLDHFRRLTRHASEILSPGGTLIVELMPEQMDAAMRLARMNMRDVASVSSRLDMMGRRRALIVETRESRF